MRSASFSSAVGCGGSGFGIGSPIEACLSSGSGRDGKGTTTGFMAVTGDGTTDRDSTKFEGLAR